MRSRFSDEATDVNTRIFLVRHGRSAHVHTGWIDAAGLQHWMTCYDNAGIAADEAPPALLQTVAYRVGVVACSDMPRARASAELLAPNRAITESPLLREASLNLPVELRCRLPLSGWALVIGARWVRRRLRGDAVHENDKLRATQAAEWLDQLARNEGDVLAVTHATFRGVVAGALQERGWQCATRWRRYHHWSVWSWVRGSEG